MKSEQINEIATALAKAQGQIAPAKKDGKNPHLGNSYATLDSIIATVRKPLSDNGLSFSQMLQTNEAGFTLETWLLHSSGQFMMSELPVSAMSGNRGVNEMQALGSTLTYLKRYALAAMLGVGVGDDDDGNTADNVKPAKKQAPKPAPKNGNGKQPAMNAAQEKLWQQISGATDYYSNIFHALKAVGNPALNKPDEWPQIIADAVDYARHKQAEAVTDEEMNQETLFEMAEQDTSYKEPDGV